MPSNRALVVEDDASLRRTLERTLARHCGEIHGCGSLAEARRLLREARPDLVLLDLFLPDGDAFGLVDDIRGMRPAPALVVMSGSEDEGHFAELERRGVRVRLRKPLSAHRLEEALQEALRQQPPGPAPS